jgi:hypothetical protein
MTYLCAFILGSSAMDYFSGGVQFRLFVPTNHVIERKMKAMGCYKSDKLFCYGSERG